MVEEEEFGYNVWIKGNRCHRCKHKWIPRDMNEKPAVCPKCKSPYWNRAKKEAKNE